MEHLDSEPIPASSTSAFLHAVGRSTIRQGFTVPLIAQTGWLSTIQKGQNVPVSIQFPGNHSVSASLRRINNAKGHLQFRYESKQQAPLRDYLTNIFRRAAGYNNAVLKITEVEHRVFSFEPISCGDDNRAFLSLCDFHFHNCSKERVEELREFKELGQCLANIPYDEAANQSEYNKRIATNLREMGWTTETRILAEIGLRCDFVKNGFWVEVEFGNARVYYQDYIKFMLAARYRQARLGVLLCPTSAFAQLLCDLGQRRAAAKRKDEGSTRPTYSGMMSHEKAVRELPLLEFMLNASVLISGIEIAQAKPG